MLLWKLNPGQPSQHNFIKDCLLIEEEMVLGGAVISENQKRALRGKGWSICPMWQQGKGGGMGGWAGNKLMSTLCYNTGNILRVAGIVFGNQCYQICPAKIPYLPSQGSKVVIKVFSAHHRGYLTSLCLQQMHLWIGLLLCLLWLCSVLVCWCCQWMEVGCFLCAASLGWHGERAQGRNWRCTPQIQVTLLSTYPLALAKRTSW